MTIHRQRINLAKCIFRMTKGSTLLSQDYSYEVTATGYQDEGGTGETVSGGLVEEAVTLSPL